MKTPISLACLAVIVSLQTVSADSVEMRTPPATEAEKEAVYTVAIEARTADILKQAGITDAAKSNAVHEVIIAQYRALRTRDAGIDGQLKTDGREVNYANRAARLQAESKLLHEKFLARLAASLTPEEVEKIKDGLTYKKVQVTYNAYCEIVPNLTDADKAKILEQLKLAREEAMDGGNAPEKSEIFQKHKDQINAELAAKGIDVAKLTKEWEAKRDAEKKTTEAAK
ncbi:MAG: DUF3826 domain-containing protein [Verrucomicrobiota bacterium]